MHTTLVPFSAIINSKHCTANYAFVIIETLKNFHAFPANNAHKDEGVSSYKILPYHWSEVRTFVFHWSTQCKHFTFRARGFTSIFCALSGPDFDFYHLHCCFYRSQSEYVMASSVESSSQNLVTEETSGTESTESPQSE